MISSNLSHADITCECPGSKSKENFYHIAYIYRATMNRIVLVFIISLVCGEAIDYKELIVDEPVNTSENDTGPESRAGDMVQAPMPIVIYIQCSSA